MIKDIIEAFLFLWPIIILIILLVVIFKNVIKLFRKDKSNNSSKNLENNDSDEINGNLENDNLNPTANADVNDNSEILINVPIFFGTIPIRIKSITFYFFMLSIGCIAMILLVLYRDYSYAYNGSYQFEVFYNEKKIQELVTEVRERDSTVNIPSNWNSKRFNYLDSIPYEKSPFIEEITIDDKIGDYLHTTGLSVHKTSYYRFFQNYKIDKVEGFLKHEYNPPNKKGIVYTSTYEIIPADNNLIEPTIKDFFKGNYISRLRIGQTITCNSNIDYSIPILSFTKSEFFPMSKIEFSLFCFELNDEIIPFAYARYVD